MANTPQTRTDRDAESRVESMRPTSWKPPTLLPDPKPQEGWVYRWIRVSTLGQNDPTNLSSKLREGWEPVRAADHPEINIFGDDTGRFKDNILIGGLLLCKTPAEFARQRDEFYRGQASGQMRAVDNQLMSHNDARMPLFNERKSEVKFGKGT